MVFANLGGTAVKRKVFVSYHHGNDQAYYNAFSQQFHDGYDVITDNSLDRARDSNDQNYIVRYIRENHLTGSSTIIVLCGLETPNRKFVDWEIYAALEQKMAIVGMRLPPLPIVNDGCAKPLRLQDNIDSGYAVWRGWDQIYGNPANLTACIEEANKKPKNLIVNTRPRRIRNG